MIESRMPNENPLWPPPPPAVGWWADVNATIKETQTAVSSRIIILSRLAVVLKDKVFSHRRGGRRWHIGVGYPRNQKPLRSIFH